MFWSFHPLADKTNNEHLPKPFFKVIRKSLYFSWLRLFQYVSAPAMRKAKPVILLLASVSVLLRASKVATVKSKSSLMRLLIKQGLKKGWIPACPLGKQPSCFSCPGPLLAFLSSWFCSRMTCLDSWPLVKWIFQNYSPSKKIYLSRTTGWDFFRALLGRYPKNHKSNSQPDWSFWKLSISFFRKIFPKTYHCRPYPL